MTDLATASYGPELGADNRPHVQAQSERILIPVGYWHSREGDGLPHPQTLVSWTWQFRRRWRINRYLRNGADYIQFMGWSYCRFGCWRTMLGTKDLTDGVWVWPEGLAHYVARHGVRLPDEFVAHARQNRFRVQIVPSLRPDWQNRNWTFWRDWSRAQGRFEYEPNCRACVRSAGADTSMAYWRRLGRRVFRAVLRRRAPHDAA